MKYIKDDLHNTHLPILIIDERKRYNEYPQIGFGDEGSIHKYNDEIAFKTFDFTTDKKKLPKKFEKIELLGKLNDKSACFPIGLVGYEDEKKEGYFYELVHKNQEYKDFDLLLHYGDNKFKLKVIKETSDAVKRFHDMGFILGDIKGNNILIDNDNNIKFVDTDNWKYKEYDYDIVPGRSKWFYRAYKKECSELDNDKYVLGMMAIQLFLNGSIISMHQNDRYFKYMVDHLNVSNEAKDGLRIIFSDANNKPYIGDALKDINTDEEIISKEHVLKLNRFYK